MTISTPAGEVEVRIGDLFDLGAATLEIVCSGVDSVVCCRVVSGILVIDEIWFNSIWGVIGDLRPLGETFGPGEVLTICPKIVSAQVLLSNRDRRQLRIPTSPTRTKARPKQKAKPESQQGTLL